ncbi:MAG TPA: glycerophosphodiester phosphodiesterase [Gemmatimonadaceae bacterium]|nr:glycerophosphodiester phosphodiesterase [Gemmatimonadaceae bacterium]
MSRTTPEKISHRGAHQTLPENSIPAFLRAIELGADAIELDVHGTRDGMLVVHHDAEVNAPAAGRHRIADLTMAELGAYKLRDELEIPTLTGVLSAIGTTAFVYVEIKAPDIEPLVTRCIRESESRCAIHSFDHRIVKNVKRIFPALRTGVLEVSRHIDPTLSLTATGAEDLWQDVGFIDEELVARVHSVNGRVIAWTANDANQWETLRRIGVDGICTDRIAELGAFVW